MNNLNLLEKWLLDSFNLETIETISETGNRKIAIFKKMEKTHENWKNFYVSHKKEIWKITNEKGIVFQCSRFKELILQKEEDGELQYGLKWKEPTNDEEWKQIVIEIALMLAAKKIIKKIQIAKEKSWATMSENIKINLIKTLL